MASISKDQTIALRSIAKKIFPNDERYHQWLEDNYGYSSTLELSKIEAKEAIELLLKYVGKDITAIENSDGLHVGNWLSKPQKLKIEKMEKELGWDDNHNRLLGFIKKQTGLNKDIQMLTVKEAQKVITGLTRIQNPTTIKG